MQFSTRSLLMAVSFVAIAVGGATRLVAGLTGDERRYLVYLLALSCPLWVPVPFAAYALGQRRLTVHLLVAFGVAVLISQACYGLLIRR